MTDIERTASDDMQLAADPPAPKASAGISVTIKTKDTAYTLNVRIPLSADEEYLVQLIEGANRLAAFQYKDSKDYAVSVSMPAMGSGDTRIVASFDLAEGTVGALPALPAASG